MVGLDADFLSLLLHPNPRAPHDPSTGKPVERAKEKVRHFIETLEKAREKIIIPTPALSEVLALAMDRASEYLTELTTSYGFDIAAFDQVAAVEAAIATSDAKKRGGKKSGSNSSWAKVKFDRQIVAICKVRGVDAIYSNDEELRKSAERAGMTAKAIWDLPDPPPEQADLFKE
jgi:predicted nucleic acid-binding protein